MSECFLRVGWKRGDELDSERESDAQKLAGVRAFPVDNGIFEFRFETESDRKAAIEALLDSLWNFAVWKHDPEKGKIAPATDENSAAKSRMFEVKLVPITWEERQRFIKHAVPGVEPSQDFNDHKILRYYFVDQEKRDAALAALRESVWRGHIADYTELSPVPASPAPCLTPPRKEAPHREQITLAIMIPPSFHAETTKSFERMAKATAKILPAVEENELRLMFEFSSWGSRDDAVREITKSSFILRDFAFGPIVAVDAEAIPDPQGEVSTAVVMDEAREEEPPVYGKSPVQSFLEADNGRLRKAFLDRLQFSYENVGIPYWKQTSSGDHVDPRLTRTFLATDSNVAEFTCGSVAVLGPSFVSRCR